MTLVSIIVPCYNQEEYLSTTLTSVYNQSYTNWECILVNDGSTDNTQNSIDNWVKKDSRFVSVKQENGGLSRARNSGLEKAKGEWIQFLDADDYLHEDKLTSSLTNNKDIVISNFLMFKGDIENTSNAYCNLSEQAFSFDSILFDWDVNYTIPIHCGFFKRTLVGDTRFNESIKAKEDWLFWITIFQKNPSAEFLNQELALYRLHELSMTQKEQFMFNNSLQAYKIIHNDLLKDAKYKNLFFNRIIGEYLDFKSKHFELVNSNDDFKMFQEYKKARNKYYNIWYKKYFYKFFKPNRYKELY